MQDGGTASNFNGFRVLASLLHGTLVLGVSQTLRRWTEGATTLGIVVSFEFTDIPGGRAKTSYFSEHIAQS